VVDLVVDASVLSSFFLAEEYGAEVQKLIKSDARFYAPLFWKYEAANAVWKNKDIPEFVAQELIGQMWLFSIYGEESAQWIKEALSVGRKHNITFYDSSYIAMAKWYNIPLWTLDKLQGKIASQVGVVLWEEREA